MHVGVNYHEPYAVAAGMDDKGQVIETVRLKNKPDDHIGFADRPPVDSKIAIEATGGRYSCYGLPEGKSPEIHLVHPRKTRAIAEAKINTDKLDAKILARLLQTDLLAESYSRTKETGDIRIDGNV
ncbi:MAG: hypothetical protein OEW15_04335 [Nitrospirota bacterium]|nr:hypothetical protein [Nitrospirota bacterium]